MKCEYCGKEFLQPHQSGRPRKYCSNECRYNADKDNKHIKYVWKSERADKCLMCGREIVGSRIKFCSRLCSRKYSDIQKGIIEDHGELTKVCPACGKTFKTWKSRQTTCSKVCSDRIHNQNADRRYQGKIVDHDITLQKVAERDHNQCQICGLFVDWSDYIQKDTSKICGRMYPSIDHITPISLGGLHSWDNVQLAHRKCNSRKGNKYVG